ncbi:MerR family transcriptional regulator [Eggerthellaceae bacterium 3-80]|nr:MerR family transcriptional regulator [bacterium D16-34]
MQASNNTHVSESLSEDFGTNEVSEMTGISAFTIRYYDKCGFFPNLQRDKHGIRAFSPADINQLYLVDALRKSGLSIEGIQYFVKLQRRGEKTTVERETILQQQVTGLEYQLEELKECLKRLRNARGDLG